MEVFDHKDKEEVVSLEVGYLLLPINDTNLGVGFAALLTHLLQPRVVIPCHYGYVYPAVRHQGGHPAEFVTALAARNYKIPSTDIMILSPGGKGDSGVAIQGRFYQARCQGTARMPAFRVGNHGRRSFFLRRLSFAKNGP